MNDMKYPIKYAIETMYNPVNHEVLGGVVSKCFVVEESIHYFMSGGKRDTYKVVFPYKEIDAFGRLIDRVLPSDDCDLIHFAVDVNEVFDDYEEAKRECRVINNCYCTELSLIRLSTIEEKIQKATEDLIVTTGEDVKEKVMLKKKED